MRENRPRRATPIICGRSTGSAAPAAFARRWSRASCVRGSCTSASATAPISSLAGSIRDDGPLPDVITDVLEAQRPMREKIRGVTFCLMIATTLHSIAVGNLLPAYVKVVCVDINPSTAIKLADRGTFQTVGSGDRRGTVLARFGGGIDATEDVVRSETQVQGQRSKVQGSRMKYNAAVSTSHPQP